MDHGYFLVIDRPYWHKAMTSQTLQIALLSALAAALVYGSWTDIRERIIDNWLNLGIALAAPLFWWASGVPLWPEVAIQLAQGLIVTLLFAILFAFGAMGGGDVKLLGALALWFPPVPMVSLIVIMSILGGVLTVAMLVHSKMSNRAKLAPAGNLTDDNPAKPAEKIEIPYGVAISAAGLWTIYERYLNHFG